MKRLLRLLVIPFVAGLLMVATAVPAFAGHTPAPSTGPGHDNSCPAQKRAILHAINLVAPGPPDPVLDMQVELYNSHCEADFGEIVFP